MGLSEAMLPEFDQEMASTRKTLERVPDNKLAWRPHEKSMTMGRLATHVAEIPNWAILTIEKDVLDIAPPGAPPYQPQQVKSQKEVLEMFEKNVLAARAAIAGATDQHLLKTWTLLFGGKTVFTLPRIRSAQQRHESPHPPSCPAGSVPSTQRRSGARDLWSLGG